MSDCGNFTGEKIVDGSGNYVGDGSEGAIGWTQCGWFCNNSQFEWGASPPCPCDSLGNALSPLAQLYDNPASSISVVSDTSGPRGLEHIPAFEIDGAGIPGSSVEWVGPGAGAGLHTVPTGIPLVAGVRYTCSFWIKGVPDDDGFVANGYAWHAALGVRYYGQFDIVQIPIPSDWTFAFGVSSPYPSFSFVQSPNDGAFAMGFGTDLSKTEPYTVPIGHGVAATIFSPRGRVHVKCIHLYPYGAQENVGDGIPLDGIKYRAFE